VCATSPIDDEETLVLLTSAQEAAEELLREMRVSLDKGLDLSTHAGFDAAAERLSRALRNATAQDDASALREALAVLDVDWASVSAARRSALVRQAMAAANRAVREVPLNVENTLRPVGRRVVESVRSDARERQKLAIGAALNTVDERAIVFLPRAQGLFVRDAYGQHVARLGEEARQTVAHGLEHGLGRDDIAQALAELGERVWIDRAASYWTLIASSFVGEARSVSQISAFAEAGIEQYVISAVLDEHTTDICRFLDGKVLETAAAMDQIRALEMTGDPEAIRDIRPWVRTPMGDDGMRRLTVRRGDDEQVLATVARSGVGKPDDRGAYRGVLSDRELAPAGIGYPPFHGLCRSSLLARF
jgi:hypothetical protein